MKTVHEEKTSISVRLPLALHERVHDIARQMSLDADSQLYRWIIEGFIEEVDFDGEGDPPLPVVTEMARKIVTKRSSKKRIFKRA